MAVKFRVVPRKNPQNLNDPPKYYAKSISTGKDSTYSLAKEIAMNTTMGRADIVGVLTALSEIVSNRLAMGRTVDLLDLCILSPTVSSEGVASESEFNTNKHVRKVGITIRAKKSLLDQIKNVKLEKA